MIYAGIDIAKFKHDCFIMSDFGEVVNDGFSFTNTAKGFARLQKELEGYDRNNIRIAFEATGNYAINLKMFLEKLGYAYMEINPVLVNEYIKSQTLRKTKNDKICARHIAGYLSERVFNPHATDFYDTFALKQLTRFRHSLVSNRSKHLVGITNVLDCIFPEFKPFFDNKFSVTALYILANYPSPKSIANMNICSYDILRRKSRGRFSMDKFVRLKELAKNTVGVFNEYYRIELETLIDLHSQIDSKIDEVETQITKFIRVIDPPTLSIKGIGDFSAAVIVAEYGDFSRFENPNKMLAFAGLEPGRFQSGTLEHNGKMVKHGSPHLRFALMTCANTVRLHNEVFAVYYRKKINEGKEHCVAMNHVAKKLVRVIHALETKGKLFNPDLLR
jgi:transposase